MNDYDSISKFERAINLGFFFAIIAVFFYLALTMFYFLAPILLPLFAYSTYASYRRGPKGNWRNWAVTLAATLALVGCIVTDIYFVSHTSEMEVDNNGSPNGVSAFIRSIVTKEKFITEQISIIDRRIFVVEARKIESPTEEASRTTAPIMASILSDPEIQKTLAEANAGKTQLQLSAEAHERYAENLRKQDAIAREKAFFESEKRQELERLYRTRSMLIGQLAKSR